MSAASFFHKMLESYQATYLEN